MPQGQRHRDLIAAYDALMGPDRSVWLETLPDLRRGLLAAGCRYGDRELLKVLRPKFLSSGEHAYLGYVSSVLMGVFRRFAVRAQKDESVLEFLRLSDGERRLMEPEPRCPDPCAFARLDSFQTLQGPRFVELNGEAPAGPGFCDATLSVFRTHPLVQRAEAELGITPLETRPGFLNGIITAWRASGGSGRPRILITDYLDLPTVNEFYMLRDYLRTFGFDVDVEDPRQLTYQSGRLIALGRPVDMVYRRVLTNEFLEREDQVRPLFEAYRDQAIVMVVPFRSKLVHKKATFCILTGEFLDRDWMTAEELRVVDRHLPWTRRLEEGKTEYRGKTIDLLPFVRARKDDFVVKPSDEYGGKGVVVGWAATDTEFAAALDGGIGGDWIVQERVHTTEEPFPVMERGLADQPMVVDLDPYVYFGQMSGVLARLAAGALCNVTSGGGQVPVYLYPDP